MIKSIFRTHQAGEALESVPQVEVVIQSGIVGDRNFGRSDYPGQNITFIESEAIANYNRQHGQSIEAVATRRNIVTEGIDLNALVGREFSVGMARFRGVELCTPCGTLGAALENEQISKAEVVKAFALSGGLRADVLCSGAIAVGMTIEPLPPA